MAHTPDLVGFFEHRSMFGPGCWVEHILGAVVQHSQAVIGSPTAAGGINDESITITLEHLGPFANRHRHAFPALVGFSNQNTGPRKGYRVFHRRDVDVLLPIVFAWPS